MDKKLLIILALIFSLLIFIFLNQNFSGQVARIGEESKWHVIGKIEILNGKVTFLKE